MPKFYRSILLSQTSTRFSDSLPFGTISIYLQLNIVKRFTLYVYSNILYLTVREWPKPQIKRDKKMTISQALQDAQTIDQVVEIINDGGTSMFNAEEIAGQYAYTAQLESGYDIDQAAIEAHLDCLREAGAKEFDYLAAVKAGLELKKA